MRLYAAAILTMLVAFTACEPVAQTTATSDTPPAAQVNLGPAIACERLLDVVVCMTVDGDTRTVEWGRAEDDMDHRVEVPA